jgi:hypothetical protein
MTLLETIIVALKWIAQTLMVVVGVWGLFSDPFRTDPETGRRRLTRAGWVKVSVFAIGFLLFAFTDMHERNESIAARQRQADELVAQQETITIQEKNLAYLRELLLTQHQLSEVEIGLTFPQDRMSAFADAIARFRPMDPRLDRTRLTYIATALRGGAVVRWGGKGSGQIEYSLNRPQGLASGTVSDQAPEWHAFAAAFSALFGERFEIQSESGRVLIDLLSPERPVTIRFQRDAFVFSFKAAGVRFDEIRGAVTFVCGKDTVLFETDDERRAVPLRICPTGINLRSRDPRVSWDQKIACNWRPQVTEKRYDVSTDVTAEIGEWRSANHAINATLSGLNPQ